MIFSNSFSGLPIPIKNVLLQKLFNLLSSQQDKLPSRFSYLKKDEREKIKKILTAHWEGFGQQS
jgi:aminopeptidase C